MYKRADHALPPRIHSGSLDDNFLAINTNNNLLNICTLIGYLEYALELFEFCIQESDKIEP